jgi:diguanylate cyclase (GGDEF)-like protein/PAS domain S-box-containing protein
VVPRENESDAAGTELALTGNQLSFLLDHIPDILLVLDSQGRVRWGNVNAERFWGRSLEDSIGMSALELIHVDDTELALRSLESIQAKEVGQLIELRTLTAQGWRLIEVIGSAIPQIGLESIVFCVRDVTDRRRFEVAHDDVDRFRSILQNSAYVSMWVTAEKMIASVSAALTRLFGHDPEAVEGTPLVDLFDPESRDEIEQALDSAGSATTITAKCLSHGRDRVVPVELTIVSLMRDPTLSGYVVSMRDLSELAKAESEVRAAVSLLTAALESTADGLLVVDGEGQIVSYNQRFAEMWRIPSEILDHRDDSAALAFVGAQLVDPDSFLEGVRQLYENRESQSFDTLTFLDGRTFERYSKPQRVGDEIVGRVWSFRDVSDRVRLERTAEEDHRRLADAQDVARLGTFEMNVLDGSFYWSDAYRDLLGVEPDTPASVQSFLELVHPDDRRRMRAGVDDAYRRQDGSFEAACRVTLADGEIRWLQLRTRGMFDTSGRLSKVLGTAIDVTDRHEMETARRDAEERFRLGYERSAVPSAVLTPENAITSVNPALCEFFGYDEEELWGRNIVEFVHPDDRDRIATRAQRQSRAPVELRFTTKDTSEVYGLIDMALIRPVGMPPYIYTQIQDITTRKRSEMALEHMAFHDPLTGLPNRALLQDRLQQALARSARQGTRVAVILADIDRFKLVNDTLGHAAGDRILVDLANRLRSAARASDTVSRLGGDEFVMVCEDVDLEDGVDAIARRMAAAFDQPFRVADRELYLTLSAGVVLPEAEEAAGTCLRDGDVAMYRAKELGGARSELFSPEMLSPVAQRLDLETALRRALETNELRVAYQPIIDLATGRPVAVEALCRWTHPAKGEMSPTEFIRVAEQSGLILALGRLVTDEAVQQITRWRRELTGGQDLTVWINVSSAELSADLVDHCRLLNEGGAFAGSYHFEITESVLMADFDAAAEILRQLSELGISVSIDDFGTGYSSLEYLRLLPVASLKIDQSFVAGLGTGHRVGPSIVRAVVALADALDLESCGEGVETEEQRLALIELGCEKAQGFLWSPALTPPEFEQWWVDNVGQQPADPTVSATS